MSGPPPPPPSHAPAPPSAERPPLARIGQEGQPIRALAFGAGQFDAAMQLGVIHALLVSNGRPPDVVIGASAGAVNAVALAEVFQAGDEHHRVARFRQIYERVLTAPGQLGQALKPDFFQIDTQRPLEPVSLPIHSRTERAEREEAVGARAGLINLYNALLELDVTFGTVTRAIRRALGIKEAGAEQARWKRWSRLAVEGFRAWMLAGHNLHRLRSLVRPAVRALWRREFKTTRGATAGELIFRSASATFLWRTATSALALALLMLLWLAGAAIPLAVFMALGLAPAAATKWATHLPWIETLALAAGVGAALSAVAIAVRAPRERWRTLSNALWTLLTFVTLIVAWGALLVAAAAIPLVVAQALDGVPPGWALVESPKYWAVAIALGVILLLSGGGLAWRSRRGFGRWLLAQYNIDQAVFSAYPLRQLLIGLFDPSYHGPLDIDAVVERAIRGERAPGETRLSEKRLDGYAAREAHPIHVLVAAADVGSGRLRVLPGSWRVIDGLTAALATVPLFPPVPCDARAFDPERRTTSLLVDARVVANDPTRPLFSFLRRSPKVNPKAAALLLYPVAPLPFSQHRLGPEPGTDGSRREYTTLVEIVQRALELRRFRDAALERRLTELHTTSIPKGKGLFYPEQPEGEEKKLLRTWVYPIEPETPLRVNEQVMRAGSEAERRAIIGRTVADGCRAALETMLHDTLQGIPREPPAGAPPPPEPPAAARVRLVPCHTAVKDRRGDVLPGSEDPKKDVSLKPPGPGLREVCEHCAVFRHLTKEGGAAPRHERMLRVEAEPKRRVPDWPKAAPPGQPAAPEPWEDYERAARSSGKTAQIRQHWKDAPGGQRWPRTRNGVPGTERPTVSLLFSGGVFRGVFQMGVLNALSEVGLRPDVVAGASVGSITAAMVARAFISPTKEEGLASLAERQRQVLRLAAAYLGMDRLVLTDRFADFVRGVTVRAAQAGFSVRQADRVFRRFDAAGARRFSRELRAVLAGIERLTYVSPFELYDLVDAVRRQEWGRTLRLLRRYAQEWLDRVGVPHEVLGAEPLERLIAEYVLEGLPGAKDVAPNAVPLKLFADQGIFLLATATDLTNGELQIIGEGQLAEPECGTTLLDTLLTSSAFPGVFRPRWLWEFDPTATEPDQYIDGGVMDNLPLDAVAQFLHHARRGDLVAPHPKGAPHLVFCASLEEHAGSLDEAALDELRHNWISLLRRAKRLGYNDKLQMFRHTQRNLLHVVQRRLRDQPFTSGDWQPLSLEIVTVIPRWLCNTFGFHPMLGFRRARQAESIAHGCASTLRVLAGVRRDWLEAWGTTVGRLPDPPTGHAFEPHPDARGDGDCWFQPGHLCPFSARGQAASDARLEGHTAAALVEVYGACGRAATHVAQGEKGAE